MKCHHLGADFTAVRQTFTEKAPVRITSLSRLKDSRIVRVYLPDITGQITVVIRETFCAEKMSDFLAFMETMRSEWYPDHSAGKNRLPKQ
jgi:hypothetical protein